MNRISPLKIRMANKYLKGRIPVCFYKNIDWRDEICLRDTLFVFPQSYEGQDFFGVYLFHVCWLCALYHFPQ